MNDNFSVLDIGARLPLLERTAKKKKYRCFTKNDSSDLKENGEIWLHETVNFCDYLNQ